MAKCEGFSGRRHQTAAADHEGDDEDRILVSSVLSSVAVATQLLDDTINIQTLMLATRKHERDIQISK